METTGRIKGITRDWKSEKLLITIEIDHSPADLETLTGCDALDITARRHREKRSLNANSYFHVLVSKIAEKTGNTITCEKNRLIREYGFFEYINGKIPTITMKKEYEDGMLLMDGIHVRVIARDADTVRFGLMRGSHTYNTAEMSRLIDGTVEEAKELQIETLTPAQIERMKASWTGSD